MPFTVLVDNISIVAFIFESDCWLNHLYDYLNR